MTRPDEEEALSRFFKVCMEVYHGKHKANRRDSHWDQTHTGDNQEKALFATNEIHQIITERSLGKGSEFNLKRNKNGKPGSSKFELSLVSAANPTPPENADNFREFMRQCLVEAIDITRSFTDVPFHNDDVRAICSSLFIARTR